MAKFVNAVQDAKAQRKKLQAFFTPSHLCEWLIEVADLWPGALVLEPSAGDGRIASLVNAKKAKCECYEINEDLHTAIEDNGGKVIGTDFLAVKPVEKYDAVVMNPPFNGKTWQKHVAHALKFLKPGRRLVSIVAWDPEAFARATFELPNAGNVYVEEIPPAEFKEYGTDVKTLLVTINKNHPEDSRTKYEGFDCHNAYQVAITLGSDGRFYQRHEGKIVNEQTVKEEYAIFFRDHFGWAPFNVNWAEVVDYLNMDKTKPTKKLRYGGRFDPE